MLDKNLSAAEVARRVWGTSTDKRGYEVAKNRDRIGHYLAGTSYPEPENLQKLADAIDVPVERLGIGNRPRPITREPRGVKEAINQLQPDDVQLFFVGGDLSAARLLVNRTIRAELAMQIIKMLREDEHAGKDPANPMRIKVPDTA
jgi:transcriptional regulator with XRE-family HTH domain